MPRKIESLFIDGPAGRLEALLEAPEEAAHEVALVCHPHPQHGGTMHNKVVYRIARGLRGSGAVTLRFNYRGVNLSAGQYAEGEGELDDARAALDYLRGRYPDLPCTLAGFSFGSRIVLRLAKERVSTTHRVIPVGFPDRYRAVTDFDMPIPRIFIQSTHDEFGPVESIRSLVDSLNEPKRLILVEAQDHFFAGGAGGTGGLDQLEKEILKLS